VTGSLIVHRILEVISPADFEKFFDTMTELASRGELNPERMGL
jgi:hypothetical protein